MYLKDDTNKLQHVLSHCFENEDGCWLWQGGLTHGYGQLNRRAYGTGSVHIFVWRELIGEIPDGLVLDHICHNQSDCPGGECIHRRCCNPAHLEPKPNSQNVLAGKQPSMVAYRTNICQAGLHNMADAYIFIRPDGRSHRSCKGCERIRAKKRWTRIKKEREMKPV